MKGKMVCLYLIMLLFVFNFVGGVILKSLYRKESSLFPRKGSNKLMSNRARFVIPKSGGSSDSNGRDSSDQIKANMNNSCLNE